MSTHDDLRALWCLTETLRTTPSTTAKRDLLADTLTASPGLAKYFRAAYDPHRQFYLTPATAKNADPYDDPDREPTFFQLLKWLHERRITGRDAQRYWMWLTTHVLKSPEQRKAADAVLDKDLKCGVGPSTINSAFVLAGLEPIPTFDVALGYPWKGESLWDGFWLASRKLDGVRCLAFLDPPNPPELRSRPGKLFNVFATLERELSAYDGPPIVLDGEVAKITEDGSDDFKGMQREIHKKNHDIADARLHVFDAIPPEVFWAGHGIDYPTLAYRHVNVRRIVDVLESHHVHAVKQITVRDEAHFQRLYDAAVARGWEGMIARRDAPYSGTRSRDIYKVKPMQDLEAVVAEVETGEMLIREAGKASHVEEVMTRATIKYKGQRVGVGSGWSIEQRRRYRRHPNAIIGKTITVQYFEETTDKRGRPSLRFPTVKVVHGAGGRDT